MDVLMTGTGARLSNVQMASHDASSNSGTANLPSIGNPIDDTRWTWIQDPARTVYAVMASVGGMPICLGLLYPQVGQMQFAAPDQKIVRHSSDFYELTQANGDHEMSHPSGSFVKIGSNGTHTDLTARDVDGNWKIANNTGAAGHINMTVANAGSVVATIDIDSSGNIAINHNGNLTVTTKGNANVTVDGTTEVTSEGAVTVNASAGTTHNGPLTINGLLTFTEGMAGSGGSGNTMNLTGNVGITGGVTATEDVEAGGVSLINHLTSGVQSGGDQSGPPVPGT